MTVPEAYLQDIVWPANFNEIPKEIFVRQDLYQAEIAAMDVQIGKAMKGQKI